jgi:hypothetical protein
MRVAVNILIPVLLVVGVFLFWWGFGPQPGGPAACAGGQPGCNSSAYENFVTILRVLSVTGLLLVSASMILLGLTIRQPRTYIHCIRR